MQSVLDEHKQQKTMFETRMLWRTKGCKERRHTQSDTATEWAKEKTQRYQETNNIDTDKNYPNTRKTDEINKKTSVLN